VDGAYGEPVGSLDGLAVRSDGAKVARKVGSLTGTRVGSFDGFLLEAMLGQQGEQHRRLIRRWLRARSERSSVSCSA
jgi:uncharacterized protein YggL (DUF469 family)